jgi:murein DD-endopeptidase MepM/ murein hydrolase activator NlpD
MMPRVTPSLRHPRRRAIAAGLAVVVCAVIAGVGTAAGQTIPPVTSPPTTVTPPTSSSTTAAPATTAPAGSSTSTTAKSGTAPAKPAAPAPDLVDTADPATAKAATELVNAVQGAQVLQAAISRLDGEISTANSALAEQNQNVSLADQQVELADQDLAAERARLTALAVARYMGGGYGGLEQVADVLSGSDTSTSGKTEALESATIDGVRRDFEASKAQSEAEHRLRDDVVRQRDALQQARDAKAAERTSTQRALDDSQGKADSLRGQVNAAALAAASGGDIGAILAAREAGQLPPPISRIFGWPLTVMHLGSPYGYRTDPVTGATGFHPGADFAQPTGTPIMAAADGTVVIAGIEGGYGNCTVIDHGQALGTLYGHQSAIIVRPGDVVKRGQVIGYVGSTGYSTGPHLHFEVRVQGKPIDPVPWLDPAVA